MSKDSHVDVKKFVIQIKITTVHTAASRSVRYTRGDLPLIPPDPGIFLSF
jgi:hypothetical protein